MTKSTQNWLLTLAKKSIEFKLKNLPLTINNIPNEAKVIKSSFVTLTKEGELRGCIGHLFPTQALYLDVINSSLGAAFSDYRFSPLTSPELPLINIEISVLSKPRKLNYKNPTDLVKKLLITKPGVILKQGNSQATFLPQVWQDLTEPTMFLSQLCLKAGLPQDQWKNQIGIKIYTVENFASN